MTTAKFTAELGPYQQAVDAALDEMTKQDIMARIWQHDYTVWEPQPDEITNRLGWLDVAKRMLDSVDEIESVARAARADGLTHALLLGMGGSSLAPEVFSETFGVAANHLTLSVLDSTDPGAVLGALNDFDPAKTLYIVSTKSGGTTETLSFFKFFYNHVAEKVGAEKAGAHFVAVTDPGSKLVPVVEKVGVRKVFEADPNLGGRYSALSHFGMAPAGMLGVDIRLMLNRAVAMADRCQPGTSIKQNMAAQLGAVMGELANAGRDKLTLVASPPVAHFGDWVEQLIAESTGKSGKGILPVVGEPLSDPDVYGNDRLFVYLQLKGDGTHDAAIEKLRKAGHPVVSMQIADLYDLGEQFFLWELAVAIAGYRIGIHPFNQPNVEAAKVQARKMVEEYTQKGKLPEQTPALTDGQIAMYGDVKADSAENALRAFLKLGKPGDYIAVQAYVQPTGPTSAALRALQTRLRDRTHLATTANYGPRFLHSTGQLHKGDGGNGLFIQITSDAVTDAAIPDEAGSDQSSISFGVLKLAQAMGDRQALLDVKRRVIRFHVGTDVGAGLARLIGAVE